jgi:hypothetical protein
MALTPDQMALIDTKVAEAKVKVSDMSQLFAAKVQSNVSQGLPALEDTEQFDTLGVLLEALMVGVFELLIEKGRTEDDKTLDLVP